MKPRQLILARLMKVAVGAGLLGGLFIGGAGESASATAPAPGYWLVAADGGTFSFNAPFFGNPQSSGPNICAAPVMTNPWTCKNIAATPSGDGYWIVSSETFEGGISSMVRGFGSASVLPNPPPLAGLNAPVVGVAASADDGGVLLVASDGGVFTFGDATFYGSGTGGHNVAPTVGIVTNPHVNGYWLVGSNGAVRPFGGAVSYGDISHSRLNAPVIGMASTPDGKGYWLIASDGGVFTFGDAAFFGSTGNLRLNAPVVGMTANPQGSGYWLVAADGGVFSFGDAPFLGSMSGHHLNAPIVGISARP